MSTELASKLTRRLALLSLPVLSFVTSSGLSTADEKPTLTIFNWSEYIDPEVYSQFEKEFNCKVKEVTFETPEEAINKIIAGGIRTFDVCSVGSDFMVPTAIAQNVFKKLDHTRIPNLKNLAPLFQDPGYDPGNSHTIPYQWGTTGVFIREGLVPADGFSMDAFFKPGG
jgi:spermidine/putrescine transport system substrate-binding protein